MFTVQWFDEKGNEVNEEFASKIGANERFDELVDNGQAVAISLLNADGDELQGFNEGAHFDPRDEDEEFDDDEDFDFFDDEDFDDEIGYDPYAGAYDFEM